MIIRAATFSEPNMRATLARHWDPTLPRGMFIGANPGKADGKTDDATARKYVGFARRWGWGSYVACNLFQWVATDMNELIERIMCDLSVNPADPDTVLREQLLYVDVVCLAWGNEPRQIRGVWDRRAFMIRQLTLRSSVRVVCAARNRSGDPAHLSRLPYTEAPLPW